MLYVPLDQSRQVVHSLPTDSCHFAVVARACLQGCGVMISRMLRLGPIDDEQISVCDQESAVGDRSWSSEVVCNKQDQLLKVKE